MKIDRPIHHKLSDREYYVFRSLANGARPTAIAKELGLSHKTISTYRHRALQKLGFKSNTEMALYALKQGLIVESN